MAVTSSSIFICYIGKAGHTVIWWKRLVRFNRWMKDLLDTLPQGLVQEITGTMRAGDNAS